MNRFAIGRGKRFIHRCFQASTIACHRLRNGRSVDVRGVDVFREAGSP
ncbi:MAG: hypothetical protein AAGJ40_15615 [Planctomycetota bacterium]